METLWEERLEAPKIEGGGGRTHAGKRLQVWGVGWNIAILEGGSTLLFFRL